MTVIRILIHPQQDKTLLTEVREVLKRAVAEHPDMFDEQSGVPSIVDHFGYHDAKRSAVVLSVESRSLYHRLTIRPGLHPVFNELLLVVFRYWMTGKAIPV